MLFTEYNEAEVMQGFREEGYEEGVEKGLEKGREEGRAEGREEGRAEGRILARYEDGMTAEEIAVKMNLPVEFIREVIERN